MENDSQNSIEYARCYSNELNYVFFQDSNAYAVYGDSQATGYENARTIQGNQANLPFINRMEPCTFFFLKNTVSEMDIFPLHIHRCYHSTTVCNLLCNPDRKRLVLMLNFLRTTVLRKLDKVF